MIRLNLILAHIAVAAAFVAAPAQTVSALNPAVTPAQLAATQAKADAAQAAATAAQAAASAACQPMAAIPPAETVAGSAGSGAMCRLVNAVQPRITRTATCSVSLLSGSATCSTTWEGGSFPAGTVVRLAGAPAYTTSGAGLATEQPIQCKAYDVTVAGVSFRCWQAQSTALTTALIGAGVTVYPFTAPASATVSVVAIPSS